jgi:hypothetical protein
LSPLLNPHRHPEPLPSPPPPGTPGYRADSGLGNGGAIRVHLGSFATITGTVFSNCYAANGGAIAATNRNLAESSTPAPTTTLTVRDCSFENCMAYSYNNGGNLATSGRMMGGGAIVIIGEWSSAYPAKVTATVTSSNFTGCEADWDSLASPVRREREGPRALGGRCSLGDAPPALHA